MIWLVNEGKYLINWTILRIEKFFKRKGRRFRVPGGETRFWESLEKSRLHGQGAATRGQRKLWREMCPQLYQERPQQETLVSTTYLVSLAFKTRFQAWTEFLNAFYFPQRWDEWNKASAGDKKNWTTLNFDLILL